jgi:hypothetical protein
LICKVFARADSAGGFQVQRFSCFEFSSASDFHIDLSQEIEKSSPFPSRSLQAPIVAQVSLERVRSDREHRANSEKKERQTSRSSHVPDPIPKTCTYQIRLRHRVSCQKKKQGAASLAQGRSCLPPGESARSRARSRARFVFPRVAWRQARYRLANLGRPICCADAVFRSGSPRALTSLALASCGCSRGLARPQTISVVGRPRKLFVLSVSFAGFDCNFTGKIVLY